MMIAMLLSYFFLTKDCFISDFSPPLTYLFKTFLVAGGGGGVLTLDFQTCCNNYEGSWEGIRSKN